MNRIKEENIVDVNWMLSNMEIHHYNTSLPPFIVFRNIDRVGGVKVAHLFENIFGLDVLSASSVKVHCGAVTSGVACNDNFSKIWPRGMGLDYGRTDRVRWLLDLALEIAQKNIQVKRQLPLIGDMTSSKLQHQVLYYKAGNGDFHPHLDGPVTGFVSILSLGNDSQFCIDDSEQCHRFYHKRKCPATGKYLDYFEKGKKVTDNEGISIVINNFISFHILIYSFSYQRLEEG